jgi:hypothetical protein
VGSSRFAALLAATAAFLALVIAGCEGDKGAGGGRFEISAKVDRFGGPTPLITRFSATSKHAQGDVIYRWRFDDGTTSMQQSPTHSFKRAGYYAVILDARDESGNNDRESFLLGAWPPWQWSDAMRDQLTPDGARRAQRVQQRRTDVRHAETRAVLRRRAAAQTQG